MNYSFEVPTPPAPHPPAPPRSTALRATARLTGDALDQAWEVYRQAFEPLEVLAVERHLMSRAEFDAVGADERVDKHVVLDEDGRVRAFGTLTAHFAAMPLLSEPFFAHRWPEHHAQRRLWYVGCVCVDPARRGDGLLPALMTSMCRVVGEEGGLAVLDVCRHNEEEVGLVGAIDRVLDAVAPGARATRLDAQAFWAWEFPPAGRPDVVRPRGES
ncbi:hypothetical protein [Kineococcus indalonis]|uniref:hypothetical protein n=1 Tax=Kineococcus indalonis TaxID=2696566 RepID=UPI001413245E|nr:hypothetical protein [Kineococcus indalonis]NAZ87464.1 hypothetical protein [Kineococcus indalonis]